MVSFYKHDIPKWMDGTEELSDGAYRAYHVVCQLIYLNEEPIVVNVHGLAGRCRQSVRSFKKNLDELLAAGKLRLENNRLHNSKAEKVLEKIGEHREKAGRGGIKSGEVRKAAANSLGNNNSDEVPLQEPRTYKTRLDKTIEVQSPKRETGASAPQLFEVPQSRTQEPETATPEAELFRRGRAVLGQKAGGIIQKLLKAKDGSVGMARSVVEAASTKGNPTEYVMGAINSSIEREHEARAYTNII